MPNPSKSSASHRRAGATPGNIIMASTAAAAAPPPATSSEPTPSTSTAAVLVDPAEINVGISVYRNDDAPGFSAVLKARYSDFLVHEVGLDGCVAKLEQMDPEIRGVVAKTNPSDPHEVQAEAGPTRTVAAPSPEREEGRRSDGDEAVGGLGNDDDDVDDDGSIPLSKKQKVETNEAVAKNDEIPSASGGSVQRDESSFPPLDWEAIEAELVTLIGEGGEVSGRALVEFLTNRSSIDGKDEQPPQHYHVLPSMPSKEARRGLHEWIRTRLGSVAVADTHDRRVRVWHKRFESLLPNFNNYAKRQPSSSLQEGRQDRRRQSRQELGNGDGRVTNANRHRYLRFVLYKENMDTTSAMRMVQNAVGGGDRRGGGGRGDRKHSRPGPRMGYAGMKDKRGVTCQFVTIKVEGGRVEAARRIAETMCRRWNVVAATGDGSGAAGGGHTQARGAGVVRVGDFSWVDNELQLGDLSGNRFDIVLRNLQGDTASVEAAASAFRDHGFINYFGMQRFGKYGDTHLVGIAVLRGEYETAIDIILRPKSDEAPQYRDARVEWRDRFKGMSPGEDRRAAERRCADRVVRKLGRFMNSEVSVLQSLARHPLEYKRAFSCISKTLRMMYLHAVQSYVWNFVASHRVKNMGRSVVPGDLIVVRNEATPTVNPQSVRVATDEDVSSEKYTLEDVILPLVGSATKIPENECSAEIDRVLQDQRVSLDMFHRLSDREMDVSGDYRKLLCHPRDVDFEVLRYNSPLQPLIQTDLMRLQSIVVEAHQVAPSASSSSSLRAIRIGFTLPPSSYATIAIRELMKRPCSSDYQSEQCLDGAGQNDEDSPIS